MFQLILKGGLVMYLLFICSFFGIYIIVQKWLYLKHNRVESDFEIEKIKNNLVTVGKTQTLNELRTERKLMLRVLAVVLKLSDLSSKEDIRDGIKEITYLEIPKLEKNLNILSSIITVAPILGLLGTVLGLMDIFNVISGGHIGDATLLSSGIAEALITTVTGLSIAIPFIFAYQLLSHKVEMFILDMERFMNDILHFCKSHGGVKP